MREPARSHIILLVEDEFLIREALASYLEECGFTIIQAASGDAALAILKQPMCLVDLVFTDVRMPGSLDGLGLARWVMENRPNLPVIIASGNVSKEAAAHELCGAESVGKPFDYGVVAEKIRTSLSQHSKPN